MGYLSICKTVQKREISFWSAAFRKISRKARSQSKIEEAPAVKEISPEQFNASEHVFLPLKLSKRLLNCNIRNFSKKPQKILNLSESKTQKKAAAAQCKSDQLRIREIEQKSKIFDKILALNFRANWELRVLIVRLSDFPAKFGVKQVSRTGVRFVRLQKWRSDKMDKSDICPSDLSDKSRTRTPVLDIPMYGWHVVRGVRSPVTFQARKVTGYTLDVWLE